MFRTSKLSIVKQLYCATIAFAFTNISYFAVEVNTLYHSLTLFGDAAHNSQLFFGKNDVIIPKSYNSVKYTFRGLFFYAYCLTDKIFYVFLV